MTSVDLAAITAAQGVSVPLFGGRLPSATGSSDPLSGFDAAGSLYVILHAVPRSKQTGVTPSLVVTVEHSDDGVSWSTAATSTTFDGSDDGMDLLTIDTPKSRVRLSWIASGSAWLLSATAKPGLAAAASPGGSSAVVVAKKLVTAADILAFPTTSVTLVATPGPGKAIVPLKIVSSFNPGSVPYTGGTVISYLIGDDGVNDYAFRLVADGALIGFGRWMEIHDLNQDYGSAVGDDPVLFEDLPILMNFSPYAPQPPFLDGDGTITVTVSYFIADLT